MAYFLVFKLLHLIQNPLEKEIKGTRFSNLDYSEGKNGLCKRINLRVN